MIVKLIVHGKDRQEAIRRMHSALGEVIIEGVTTNLEFLYRIMERKDYQEGDLDNGWLERILDELKEG